MRISWRWCRKLSATGSLSSKAAGGKAPRAARATWRTIRHYRIWLPGGRRPPSYGGQNHDASDCANGPTENAIARRNAVLPPVRLVAQRRSICAGHIAGNYLLGPDKALATAPVTSYPLAWRSAHCRRRC